MLGDEHRLGLFFEEPSNTDAAPMGEAVRTASRFLNHDVQTPLRLARNALELAAVGTDPQTLRILGMVMKRLSQVSTNLDAYQHVTLAHLAPQDTPTETIIAEGTLALKQHFGVGAFSISVKAPRKLPEKVLPLLIGTVLETEQAKTRADRVDLSLNGTTLTFKFLPKLTPQGPAPYKGARREFLLRWQNVLLKKYGLTMNLIWREQPTTTDNRAEQAM